MAITNQGARKGGAPEAWQTVKDSPGLQDLWQLHYSSSNDRAHNSPEALIANLTDHCQGDWILLTASKDGAFTVQNGRTRFSKSYR